MKVLLLGGTGFLGSALVPRLLERHHEVAVLTRRTEASTGIAGMGAKPIVGDLLAPESVSPQISGIEAMVLIAQPPIFGKRIGASRFARLSDELIKMTESALQLAKEASCPIVLTAGTAFRTNGAEVADESWPLTRTGIARMGERVDPLLERTRAAGSPKYIRLLPGQIYGPGGMFLKMVEMAKSGRNGIIGDGKNCIPRIHVDDCADAYVRAIERLPELSMGETFIVADDVACTTEEFARQIATVMGLKQPTHVPGPMLVILRLVLGTYLFETMSMDCRVTNAKLKRVLGWAPRYPSIREGLAATAEALRASAAARPGERGR